MKTLVLVIVSALQTSLLFSQTTYDVLRLSDSQHKGILQFGQADVIFENNLEGNGYSFQVKNWYNSSYNNTFKINANGNVGIGTMSPSSKLEIKGDLKLNDATSAHKGIIRFGLDDVIIENSPDGNNYNDIQFKNWNGAAGYTNTLRLKGNGNVGIGTTTNIDAKLTVAGDIHSREVKVTINAGADFVFAENYQLKPLAEIEDFIAKNNHLPEIAPAKEMEEKGLELGKMDIKLLQKIEELTLYLIEQNKKIEVLEAKILELSNK